MTKSLTREEILALARQAGLQRTNPGEAIEVVQFAALMLEAAAVECERLEDDDYYCDGVSAAFRAATRVRALNPAKESKP